MNSGNENKDTTRSRRRRAAGIKNMTDRKRSFSPKYRPLMEEDEPPEEVGLSPRGGSVHSVSSTSSCSSRLSGSQNMVEKVVILSDHGEERNGDADSGISVSEEHPMTGRGKGEGRGEREESLLMLVLQILIPFFFAGFGMMAAGLLLDAVQVSI